MNEKTNDFEKRKEDFTNEYKALVEKHGVGLAMFPQYNPQQDGSFSTTVITQLVDMKNLPVPSPLQSDDIIKK